MIWWEKQENWGAWAHLHYIYAITWITYANQTACEFPASAGTLARQVRACYTERARNIRQARCRARRNPWIS